MLSRLERADNGQAHKKIQHPDHNGERDKPPLVLKCDNGQQASLYARPGVQKKVPHPLAAPDQIPEAAEECQHRHNQYDGNALPGNRKLECLDKADEFVPLQSERQDDEQKEADQIRYALYYYCTESNVYRRALQFIKVVASAHFAAARYHQVYEIAHHQRQET